LAPKGNVKRMTLEKDQVQKIPRIDPIKRKIEKIKAIVINVYCPNDHKASYVFLEKFYDKIFELLDKHPDAFL
jgi:adenine specific DNA methylase Mod